MKNTNFIISTLHLLSPISVYLHIADHITTLSFRPRKALQINQSYFLISNSPLTLKLCKEVIMYSLFNNRIFMSKAALSNQGSQLNVKKFINE